MRSGAATSTRCSRRPTSCARRARTRCWRPRGRPACAGSSRRASPPTGRRARAGRSRPRTTRSTPTRPRTRSGPSQPWPVLSRGSPRPAGLFWATGPSGAPGKAGSWGRGSSRGPRSSAAGAGLPPGAFYAAGTDGLVEPVLKRRYPIIGDGGGMTSWIHLEDAAAATVLALEHDGPATYNIVDDEPAPVRDWLPVLADALGAKPPRRFPTWLARLAAGEAAVVMGTEARGASNAKAKRELGWTPRHPSWRRGFAATYSAIGVADGPKPQPATQAKRVPG